MGKATLEGYKGEKKQGGTCNLGTLGEEDMGICTLARSHGSRNPDTGTLIALRELGGQHITAAVQVKELSPRKK